MGSDPNCEFSGREMFPFVASNVESDLMLDRRQPDEPFAQLDSQPDAGEIRVSPSVPKPSSHLEEGVVCRGAAHEVAGDQALQRQTSREGVTADRDDGPLIGIIE